MTAAPGIGFETARQLGQQGIQVLLGARSEAKGTDAAGKLKREGLDVELILLDVDDEKPHKAAAKYIEENYCKLDILINNAGVAIDEVENGAPVCVRVVNAQPSRDACGVQFQVG